MSRRFFDRGQWRICTPRAAARLCNVEPSGDPRLELQFRTKGVKPSGVMVATAPYEKA